MHGGSFWLAVPFHPSFFTGGDPTDVGRTDVVFWMLRHFVLQ